MMVQACLTAQEEAARATGHKSQSGEWQQRGELRDWSGTSGQKSWILGNHPKLKRDIPVSGFDP
eukprot:11950871-Prorocentrum_lima.AAC.1